MSPIAKHIAILGADSRTRSFEFYPKGDLVKLPDGRVGEVVCLYWQGDLENHNGSTSKFLIAIPSLAKMVDMVSSDFEKVTVLRVAAKAALARVN